MLMEVAGGCVGIGLWIVREPMTVVIPMVEPVAVPEVV